VTGALDSLRIDGLEVACVVGVYPHERQSSQPLRVSLELFLDTREAAETERVSRTVDYAAVAAQVVFLLRSARFRLLETAAHALARFLLSAPAPDEGRAQLEKVRVRLDKPGALSGFAMPSLEITRSKGEVELLREPKPWGFVDVIHETRDAGIYKLVLAPGGTIPLHVHRSMREAELVLTPGLRCQGEPVPQGTVRRWPRGAAHVWENASQQHQGILCVDAPRFDPDDEIVVAGEPADVPPEPPWGPMAGMS
jgi:dihydroneopterin aldolase